MRLFVPHKKYKIQINVISILFHRIKIIQNKNSK